uniref:Uncharacterized protein n=1 Tax=Caenorhabditis japonica TaxID=281687 RepID=A0A8R1HIS2_CAEJA
MSAGAEIAMDSEKEETVTSSDHFDGQVQREEIVPGSSPEGVFPSEDHQMFGAIDQVSPRNLPEQLKHDEEEIIEEVLEPAEQIEELLVEDGEQQFMNMVQISQEDLYEAGFDMDDLNHLTEEQLNHVVAISQQRQAKQSEQGQDIMQQEIYGEGDGTGTDGNDYGHGHGQMVENDMQIILTNDGGVNITDSKQRQFYISPTEIANLNIDLNNFNHDHIQQLLQFALPTIKETDRKHEGTSYSREVLDQQPSTSYHHHHEQIATDKDHRSPMIGETVQIRTADGRLQEAVVKYLRGSSEFKIQYLDGGGFGYATMDQMLVPQRNRHQEGYGAPMLIRRTEMARMAAQKRAATTGEDVCPPVLKRSYLAPVVDGPHVMHQPNFCCPICDKKVFQKEPSYIVIRLPACDSCTREKIIVLDEQNI